MLSNIDPRVASLRKAHSDHSSRSTAAREPYSSWLERGGERVEEWLAEQKVDRRASIQEQTALVFPAEMKTTSTKDNKHEISVTGTREPKMGIGRRRTTGDVVGDDHEEGNVLTGIGAFAGEETQRQLNPHLSFTFSQPEQEDEPIPDAPPMEPEHTSSDAPQDRPARP